MSKKNKRFEEELVAGGIGLSLGSTAVGRLPASPAQAGVQKGLGTAGKFFPAMATVHAAGIVVKGLKELKRKK